MKGSHQPVGHPSSSSRADAGSPGQAVLGVPPVSGWLQAIKRQRGQQLETPRFDEVHQSPRQAALGSPRSVGGEFQTPRETPRPGAEENGGGKIEELSYEGPFLEGQKHGAGVLRSTNATYTGQFESDCKHGQGTLCWNDGRCYSGQFEQNKFHGSAVMTWPDGRIFDGQYARDRKHGDGTFSWSDGRRYEGQWVCGKRQGVGIYTNAKGITRRGWWQNDRPVQWDPAQELREPAAAEAKAARALVEPGGGAEAQPPVFISDKDAPGALVPVPLPDATGAEPPAPAALGRVGDGSAEGEAELDLEDRPGAAPITRPANLASPRSGSGSSPPHCSPRSPRRTKVATDAI